MQNKGIVKFIALALTLICIFYLSITWVTFHYDGKAKSMDKTAAKEYRDTLMSEKVFLGYTFKECQELSLGLGLDLKGGMNVILEVSVPDIVNVLAENSKDPIYLKAAAQAKKEMGDSQDKYVDLFVKYYQEYSNGKPLAGIFANQKMKDMVNTKSSDKDVVDAINKEIDAAIDNSYNVVRNRIDKFGVVQPNIQKLEGGSGRIMVEMPGVTDQERVRNLLQGSANLEFWETYTAQEMAPYIVQVRQNLATAASLEAGADTTKAAAKEEVAAKAEAEEKAAADNEAGEMEKALAQGSGDELKEQVTEVDKEAAKKTDPLGPALFAHIANGGGSAVGMAAESDTAHVNAMLRSETALEILPSDVRFLWEAKPSEMYQGKVFTLHAIKVTEASGRAPLEGDVVVSAKDEFDQFNKPCVSMQMNSEGARRWAQLTKQNVGRPIAIVLDNTVYSAPNVNNEITGGNSSISGNFTVEDTKDLANTLISGKMPAPTHIAHSESVGPSLGAKSIEQGIWSFAIAMVLLMIYMVVLYNWIPGMLANLALACNLFFIIGILTSFQSALTMPGIAGIVLTLGMAVDANVLIYERTKEELRAGLNVKEAMRKGYSNAFSAIFDSNLTSILTGIILYMFGTGPIRGFAVTLIIGIICSFFTAVYMTRLIYDYKLSRDKWRNLTFSTPISRKIFRETNIGFMKAYKTSFIAWGIASLVFAGFLAAKGLSWSIDFTGGRNYTIQVEKPAELEHVRSVLGQAVDTNADGETVKVPFTAIALGNEGTQFRISTNYLIDSTDPTVDDRVETILYNTLRKGDVVTQDNVETFKNPDIHEGGSIINSIKVGPSMADDITHGAIVSIIIALAAIFIYILVRFRNVAFSVGSTVALAFDAFFVIGLYSVFYNVLPMSLDIDQTFIGAILTVIGYSINDKVIVFDRMRENIQLYPNRDRWELFNTSLNQVLARTINTSSTTFLVLLSIFILGGESIRSFTFAMMLGVIFGTLSSIFIAAPIAYFTMNKADQKAAKKAAQA